MKTWRCSDGQMRGFPSVFQDRLFQNRLFQNRLWNGLLSLVQGGDVMVVSVRPKETVSMHTRDGVRLDADVYRPDADGEFPVLLMRHVDGSTAIAREDAPAADRYVVAAIVEARAPVDRSVQVAVERDALRVLSLCAVGNADEARRVGQAWLRAAPRSPLRGPVARSCAFE